MIILHIYKCNTSISTYLNSKRENFTCTGIILDNSRIKTTELGYLGQY